MISFDNLWIIMKEKGISQYTLIKQYGVSPGQITRLKRNESVSTHTVETFCRILGCNVGDIMTYLPDAPSMPVENQNSTPDAGQSTDPPYSSATIPPTRTGN